MEHQLDRDRIRDEAIGQTRDSAPPTSVTEKEQLSAEKAARLARAPGPEASISEKTASSIGERSGDAYADPASAWRTRHRSVDQPIAPGWNAAVDCALSAGRELAQRASDQFSGQRYVGLIAAFGLGFITGTVLRGQQ